MSGFCQKCMEMPGELQGETKGEMKKVGGIDSYVTQPGTAKGQILLAVDIFGFSVKNPKIVADELREQTNMTVTVPDYFLGEPMQPSDFVVPKSTDDPQPSEEQMKENFGKLGKWASEGHSPNETYPRTKQVIEALTKDGAKCGLVGFCYGGKICSLAAQDGNVAGVSIYHPAMLESDEAKNVKVPVLLNMADHDFAFDQIQNDWQKTLKEKNLLDQRSREWPKTVHGFGSRPDVNKPEVLKAYKEALSNTAAFFKEVLA